MFQGTCRQLLLGQSGVLRLRRCVYAERLKIPRKIYPAGYIYFENTYTLILEAGLLFFSTPSAFRNLILLNLTKRFTEPPYT